ncbi:MAG: hypothetical protein MUF48_24290 [Pirellulaceae bacterium]|jgi:hypothetical protein|nr:hypothetical protein [Pirellulaceae bacterium]
MQIKVNCRMLLVAAVLVGGLAGVGSIVRLARHTALDRVSNAAWRDQLLVAAQDRQEAELGREGKILLEGPLHEPGGSGHDSTAAGSTPFPVATVRVEREGIAVAVTDCHPCHAPNDQCDHTTAVTMELTCDRGQFDAIHVQCTLLNGTGGHFSAAMPRAQVHAVVAALETMSQPVESATRADFQRCLARVYLPQKAQQRETALEQLVHYLCFALSHEIAAGEQLSAG